MIDGTKVNNGAGLSPLWEQYRVVADCAGDAGAAVSGAQRQQPWGDDPFTRMRCVELVMANHSMGHAQPSDIVRTAKILCDFVVGAKAEA